MDEDTQQNEEDSELAGGTWNADALDEVEVDGPVEAEAEIDAEAEIPEGVVAEEEKEEEEEY